MQSASSRIWTHVAVSISYDDNHYTTGTTSHLQCLNLNSSQKGSARLLINYMCNIVNERYSFSIVMIAVMLNQLLWFFFLIIYKGESNDLQYLVLSHKTQNETSSHYANTRRAQCCFDWNIYYCNCLYSSHSRNERDSIKDMRHGI